MSLDVHAAQAALREEGPTAEAAPQRELVLLG